MIVKWAKSYVSCQKETAKAQHCWPWTPALSQPGDPRAESLALSLWSVEWTRDKAIAIHNNWIIKETRIEESEMVHGTASAVLLAHTRTWRISLHSQQPGLARATGTVEFRTAALPRVSHQSWAQNIAWQTDSGVVDCTIAFCPWTTLTQGTNGRGVDPCLSPVWKQGVKIFSCDVWTHEGPGLDRRSPLATMPRQSSRHGWTSLATRRHELSMRRCRPAAATRNACRTHSPSPS